MSRSILKIASIPNTSVTPARSREDRNKETALYHARLLEQRKDAEMQILASMEALLDLPSSPNADPARPSSQDITVMKNSLKPYRPSDYDSLIQERNINKLCGYVLCPSRNRQEDTKAKYRILSTKGRGSDTVNFVKRETLERWCSDDCGKRALYVKVQLNEEPAWTRVGSCGGDILLLEGEQNYEKPPEHDTTLIEKMKSQDVGLKEDELMTKMKALAIERGDERAPSRSFGLVEVDVCERRNTDGKASALVSFTKDGDSDGGPGAIEGYTPRFPEKNMKESQSGFDQVEDLMPTI